MWIPGCRLLRRPAPLLGAACTSAFVGLFLFNKIVLNRATCAASCAKYRYLSYQRLQKNEATKEVNNAATVKSFDVNFLPSNSPIEDRFVAGISDSLGTAMFSVIDGHKGYLCSQYLQKHLLQYISAELKAEAKLTNENDLIILMDMDSEASFGDFEYSVREANGWNRARELSSSAIENCLKRSFVSLDNDISNSGLADIKMINQGHSFTSEMKERVMTAIDGACSIVSLVWESDIFVANTGDCRVVVGHQVPNGTWQAIPLSVDQNAQHPGEVERITKAHPGEENTIVMNGRVLGNLMPFRTFGDVDFKWEKKYLESVGIPLSPFYFTPPYITAEPLVTHRQLQGGDKFMIVASDGLWERITNEEAVNVVVENLMNSESKPSSFTSLFKGKEQCCSENAATKLLWHALGGTDESVTELLDITPRWSRMYRDDITIIVIFFRSTS